MWEKYTSTRCYVGEVYINWVHVYILEKTTSTRLKDNLSMKEEIQVWRMPPSLRGSVEVLQLREVILHIEYHRRHIREVGPTGKY
jgi:hypothetical protein